MPAQFNPPRCRWPGTILAAASALLLGATVAPDASAAADTRPVGSPALSDVEAAARVVRSPFEPRPQNAAANRRSPSDVELRRFLDQNRGSCRESHLLRVTGRFTGTTDEILQWAAHKWGMDEQVVRAMAAIETWWKQAAVGDHGRSFGILQIKATVHGGTFPLSQQSTAFAADYAVMALRRYFDGCARWLGSGYQAGDLWGSVGAWYAGRWKTGGAQGYVAQVRQYLTQEVWRQRWF